MKLSIILPAHNEEDNLPKIVPVLFKRFQNQIIELLIVNDVSTDGTKEVCERLMDTYPLIRLINRKPPCGVGRALRDGFKHISPQAEWVLSMDADFVNNMDDVDRLIKKVHEGIDGVVGSRFYKGTRLVNYPKGKLISNRLYHILLNTIFGMHRYDLTNNFKLYRAEIFRKIKWKANNFAINAETGLYPILSGYKVKEVQVTWIQRIAGKSDFKVLKLAPGYLLVAGRGILLRLRTLF